MNTQNTAINVVRDAGFGGDKLAFINGTARAALLPSVVAVGQLRGGKLSTGLKRGKRAAQPLQVAFDVYQYLVGPNVHQHARPIERLDFSRLGDGPEQQALFYGNLWQLLGAGTHRINLLVALPVEVLQNAKMTNTIRGKLRAQMVGGHQFSVNAETLTVIIDQVKTMAQPLGSFFNWGMDTSGRWARQQSPHAKYAIADVGFNTVDLFVIEDAQINDRYTAGDTVGMRRANAFIRQAVRDVYGVRLSMYEADNLIRSYLRKKRTELHHAGGTSDLRAMIEQALAAVTGEITSFLSDTWGSGNQFSKMILTGGGAEALRDDLLRLYPHAVVMDNAQMANAIGLAKYAQRKSVFK